MSIRPGHLRELGLGAVRLELRGCLLDACRIENGIARCRDGEGRRLDPGNVRRGQLIGLDQVEELVGVDSRGTARRQVIELGLDLELVGQRLVRVLVRLRGTRSEALVRPLVSRGRARRGSPRRAGPAREAAHRCAGRRA